MNQIASAQPLQLKRFSSADEFEPARNLRVEITPLQLKIAAANVTLSLPGCDVTVIDSFPRLSDGSVRPNCTLVGFVMDEGPPVKFNGVDGTCCHSTGRVRAPNHYRSGTADATGRRWTPMPCYRAGGLAWITGAAAARIVSRVARDGG